MELKSQGVDAITLEKWAKALQTLKKKNLIAKKKRTDQAEKTQVSLSTISLNVVLMLTIMYCTILLGALFRHSKSLSKSNDCVNESVH
jgi:hypothetical protein